MAALQALKWQPLLFWADPWLCGAQGRGQAHLQDPHPLLPALLPLTLLPPTAAWEGGLREHSGQESGQGYAKTNGKGGWQCT